MTKEIDSNQTTRSIAKNLLHVLDVALIPGELSGIVEEGKRYLLTVCSVMDAKISDKEKQDMTPETTVEYPEATDAQAT